MYPSTQSVAPSTASSSAAGISSSAPHTSQRNTGTHRRRINEITFGIVTTRRPASGAVGTTSVMTGSVPAESDSERGGLCTRITRDEIPMLVERDAVGVAHGVVEVAHGAHIMAACRELGALRVRDTRLDLQQRARRVDLPTRRIDRVLRVASVDEHVHE